MTDQPTDDMRNEELEARIADLERRLRRGSREEGGRSGIETAFWATMHRIFPDEARKHLKVASREQLMAARVYLDRWIARLDQEKADEDADAVGRPHEKIEVE